MSARAGTVRVRDDGFTLPELLVTITIMTIVSAALVASVVAIQRNLGTANATMNDLAANRIAVERVGALLRGAVGPAGVLDEDDTAVVVALPERVRFYSVTGRTPAENPQLVELAVVGTDLVERIWDPTPELAADLSPGTLPTWSGLPRSRVIGRHVLLPAVFTYWSHEDDGTATGRCGRVVSGTTAADRAAVDSIAFRLRVQEPTAYAAAPSDLQGWARFASDEDLGFSGEAASAGCLDVRGFGYQEAYAP